MTQLSEEQQQQLKQIRITRGTGVLPWSHLSSPTQRQEVAESTIDLLLSLLDSDSQAAQKVGRQAFAAELLSQLDRITSTTAAYHLVKNLCKIELGQEPDSLGVTDE